MRNVEVSEFIPRTYMHEAEMKVIGKALFHCFSKGFKEVENGACEFASAVVEFPDGTVKNVTVEHIRFLNE